MHKKWAIIFKSLIVGVYCLSIFVLCFNAYGGVASTRHNLSVSNPFRGDGGVISEESQICIFCHTPHNASPSYPLWNHQVSTGITYTAYESLTLQSYTPGSAPSIDGFSKLCLGCHDGTIALGALASKGNVVTTPLILSQGDYGYLGTDLSGGHPISIVFDANLAGMRNDPALDFPMKLNWPINDPYVKLYPTQDGYGVQCTSCHDPHGGRGIIVNGVPPPPFWRKETYDDVCLVCHDDNFPVDMGHDYTQP